MLSELNNYRKAYGSGIIRGGLTFADNMVSYLLGKTPSRGPLYVDWEVTYKCNFRCSFCNCWNMADPIKELNTEEALRVVKELARSGVWLLIFTGGEPFLRKDLPQLIREAKRNGMNVSINTNGSLLKKYAKMVVDSGVDSLTVTAESHDATVHDNLRNFKGSFVSLNEGIEELKKLRKNSSPRITVRMDFTKENFKDVKPYVDFWKDRVDEIILQPIHQTHATSKYFTPTDLSFNEEDENSFIEYFEQVIKDNKKFSKRYYREFPTFFFDLQNLYKKYRCFAAHVFGQIDSFGNVYSCTEYIEKFGSLKEMSFMEIWRGKKAKNYRKIIRNRKFTCNCWYYCTGPVNSNLSRIFRC